MAKSKRPTLEIGEPRERVPFDYVKSQHFRVIRADGCIGAVTPNGHIHFALFSERQAIPRRLVHEVEPDRSLGQPIEEATESRHSIVREMDVDVFVNLQTAKALVGWLTGRIEELEKRGSGQTQNSRTRRKREVH